MATSKSSRGLWPLRSEPIASPPKLPEPLAKEERGPTRWREDSARQVVRHAAERLENEGVPEPAASAEVLLSELLGVRRSEISSYPESLSKQQTAIYEGWISRRAEREPVQRILGYAYFRNLQLELDEHALIPRPDTESVVDAALETIDR